MMTIELNYKVPQDVTNSAQALISFEIYLIVKNTTVTPEDRNLWKKVLFNPGRTDLTRNCSTLYKTQKSVWSHSLLFDFLVHLQLSRSLWVLTREFCCTATWFCPVGRVARTDGPVYVCWSLTEKQLDMLEVWTLKSSRSRKPRPMEPEDNFWSATLGYEVHRSNLTDLTSHKTHLIAW